MNFSENLKFLLKASGRERYKLYLSCLLSISSSLLSIAPYILLYYLATALIKQPQDLSWVQNLAWWIAGIIGVRLVLYLSSGIFSHVAAFSILYELRIKVSAHLSKLHMGYFNKTTIGHVKKTINEDVEKLENFIAHQIPDLAAALVAPIVIIGYLLFLKWQLALILFVPIIVGMTIQSFMFRSSKDRMAKYHQLLGKLNASIFQYIHGMTVMKAFNLTTKSFKSYRESTENYTDFWVDISKKMAPGYGIFMVIIDSGIIFMLPTGGLMLLAGQIDIPTYILFMILSTNFLNAFKALLLFGMNFSMLLGGAGKVKEILDTPIQKDGTYEKDQLNGQIDFKHVNFSYDTNTILEDFNLTIQAKEVVALVGASGSGKTTIGKLIGRFWDVDKGEVLIDGMNIKDYKLSNLMSHMAFVFQDVFMLQDSIRENIVMGEDYDENTIKEACQAARIWHFIEGLPKGLDTKLGAEGIKLSGGQKQRLSIARAMLKKASIIVLDEVTSYSDVENEVEIQEALKNLMVDKTVIIIAHRLYTIKNADRIVVIDQGQIVEQGHHDKLMGLDCYYKKQWHRGEIVVSEVSS